MKLSESVKNTAKDIDAKVAERAVHGHKAALKLAQDGVDSIVRLLPERPQSAFAKANYEFTAKLIGVFEPLWVGAEEEPKAEPQAKAAKAKAAESDK